METIINCTNRVDSSNLYSFEEIKLFGSGPEGPELEG